MTRKIRLLISIYSAKLKDVLTSVVEKKHVVLTCQHVLYSRIVFTSLLLSDIKYIFSCQVFLTSSII